MAELSKKKILWSGSTVLPAPTSLTVNDELVWSSDTGRTLSATMMGDVIAEKKTASVRWEYITEEELKIIKNTLIKGFFSFSFRDDGIDITIESYRGTLSKEHLGNIGDGKYYYKSATVDVIQR
mgnify:CR=1 FL=1